MPEDHLYMTGIDDYPDRSPTRKIHCICEYFFYEKISFGFYATESLFFLQTFQKYKTSQGHNRAGEGSDKKRVVTESA